MKKQISTTKYGLFIHWGIYSLLGGEYDGQKTDGYAEWAQSYFRIPNVEMEDLASAFTPHDFDAERIVNFAKNCGFEYIVFTAKHHDGFAMYGSKVNRFNICDCGFGRDVLKELASACKKHKIKLGIYYSQDLDWHDKNGGGFNTKVEDCAGTSWDNNWDFPNKNKVFDEYFYGKALPQIQELFSNYGKISFAWFDVPFTLSKTQSQEIFNLVNKLQPGCLINSRLGNGCFDYVSFGDNEIPNSKQDLLSINSTDNALNGIKRSPTGIYEACLTTNQSWGFTKHPKWKSLNSLKSAKRKCEELGINFLINIGLDPNGQIPQHAQFLLEKLFEK